MQQDLKSKKTQDLILNKSFELFYRKGFNKTTIPDIMKETSLSKGAFYHHFKNKKEVGKKVINGIITNRILNGFINPLMDYKNKNIPELIFNVFTERIKHFSEKEKLQGCPANNLINEIGCNESEFRVLLRSLMDNWIDVLSKTITEGVKAKQISKNVNPKALAICLIGSFEGIRGIRKIYDNDELFNNYVLGIRTYIVNISI